MQNVTALEVQVEQFGTLIEEKHIKKGQVKESLFLLESGSNDIFNYFSPFEPAPTLTPDAYIQDMLKRVESFVDQIYRLGARRIAIFSLGPVGCVPARSLLPGAPTNNRCYGKMNKMVKNFNMGLENIVKGIPYKHHGAVGVYGAVYKSVQLFRANATRYGNLFFLFI